MKTLTPKLLGAIIGLIVGLVAVLIGIFQAFILLIFILIGWLAGKFYMGELNLPEMYKRFKQSREEKRRNRF